MNTFWASESAATSRPRACSIPDLARRASFAPSPWSHAQSWLSSLERYAFPRIGKMPVSEVSSADVLEILSPIWHVKPDMAGKLRQHMRAVLEWAVALFPVVAVSPSFP